MMHPTTSNGNNDYRNAEIKGYTCKFQCNTFLDHSTGKHTNKSDYRTNGKVNTTGNDYEGHTKCKDSIQGYVLGNHGQCRC